MLALKYGCRNTTVNAKHFLVTQLQWFHNDPSNTFQKYNFSHFLVWE